MRYVQPPITRFFQIVSFKYFVTQGTPAISDPGMELVQACAWEESPPIPVYPIPGKMTAQAHREMFLFF